MKMFANLSRFIYQPGPPQPAAAPFDDGLAEIARLIAREDPTRFPPQPYCGLASGINSDRQSRQSPPRARCQLTRGRNPILLIGRGRFLRSR